MNSDPSPNYIQFNSLYCCLNTARWKARLNLLAQTNLSNLQTRVNHSIVLQDFQYPFNLLGTDTSQLIAVTHQFEAWDNQKVQYTVIILIHPCFTTQYPIIRTGHRGDCPIVTVTWWDIPNRLPNELEDTLLYDHINSNFALIPLIMCLDEFFLINEAFIHDLESQLPPYDPPSTSFLPLLTFSSSSSPNPPEQNK